ncbi:LADA_0D08966g1_1 [Lachancea dasiensis]|uniref:Nuclear fusion protein KAR5 n=1 Tax=Lachancea dasiensis TaxID=1072105 RepID=A0A1G4J7D9_9SACH|nr:LADA_0D08966g1_1 [Lachancea dasiensis]
MSYPGRVVALIFAPLAGCQIFKWSGQLENVALNSQETAPSAEEFNRIIRLNFPQYRSYCAGEALREFLPRCMQNGIETLDPQLRVQAAIKLSFCEFQESGLEVTPHRCLDLSLEGSKRCMDQMRSSPQWWTTYSGNYQRLSTLCYENSLPFEKEQLVELFLNITKIYASFSEKLDAELTRKLIVLEEFMTQRMSNFEDMFGQQVADMNTAYARQMSSFLEHLDKLQDDAFTTFSNNALAVRNEVSDFDREFLFDLKNLKHYVEDINAEFTHGDYVENIRRLKAENFESAQLISETSLSYLRGMDKALGDVGALSEISAQKLTRLDKDVTDSYVDMLTAFQDFKSLIKDSMVPFIQEELGSNLNAFSHKFISELENIDRVLSGKAKSWGKSLDSTFEKVNSGLNCTSESINELDKGLRTIRIELGAFFGTLNFMRKSILGVVRPMLQLVSVIPIAARPLIAIILVKLISFSGYFLPKASTVWTSNFGTCFSVISALIAGLLIGFYSIV